MGASLRRPGLVSGVRFTGHVQRHQRPSVRTAAKKVAVPPPSPVNVEALFAAATCYSALLTVYLLFTATVVMLKRSKKADEEVTFVYSTNAIGGLSRGKRVVGRSLNSGSMKQAVLLLLPLIAVYSVRHDVMRLSNRLTVRPRVALSSRTIFHHTCYVHRVWRVWVWPPSSPLTPLSQTRACRCCW